MGAHQSWTAIAAGGGGWIRTNVGVRQRIYSPSPLATRAPLRGGGLGLLPAPCQRMCVLAQVAVPWAAGYQPRISPTMKPPQNNRPGGGGRPPRDRGPDRGFAGSSQHHGQATTTAQAGRDRRQGKAPGRKAPIIPLRAPGKAAGNCTPACRNTPQGRVTNAPASPPARDDPKRRAERSGFTAFMPWPPRSPIPIAGSVGCC